MKEQRSFHGPSREILKMISPKYINKAFQEKFINYSFKKKIDVKLLCLSWTTRYDDTRKICTDKINVFSQQECWTFQTHWVYNKWEVFRKAYLFGGIIIFPEDGSFFYGAEEDLSMEIWFVDP